MSVRMCYCGYMLDVYEIFT